MASKLPFQKGQLVESRCFLVGYRGAWFRCKIKDIGWRMGVLSYELEFVDFPDEEVVWTKPFQKPPAASGIPSTGPKGQLMMRPQFPQVYREKQLSDSSNSQLEVTVVVNDTWKVGDLVDWWKDNCYWSGKIIAILGNKEVKLELLPPPFGEGLAYPALSKDLRPSLDWFPESGWMVPDVKVNGRTHCARVLNNGNADLMKTKNASEENGGETAAGKSNAGLQSSSMQPTPATARKLKRLHSNMTSKEKHNRTEESSFTNCLNTETKTTNMSDNKPSSSTAQDTDSTKIVGDGCSNGQPVKKMLADVSLNSTNHGSLEDAIVDLEELINRIKWIKRIFKSGMSLPNTSWKYLDHRPSSTPK